MVFQRSVRSARSYVALALFLAVPVSAGAQTTALFLQSQPGEYVLQGGTRSFTPANASFESQLTFFGNRLQIFVRRLNETGRSWSMEIDTGGGAPPVPGHFLTARRSSFRAGLDVGGEGRGCNELTGRFLILEAVFSNKSLVRFAADFEQHCEDQTPALFGAIRINSSYSSLTPFGGQYPLVRLTITPPMHGRVTGPGVACGEGQSTCDVLPVAGPLPLRAIPAPGYTFAGWRGDCSGAMNTTVNMNSWRACGAEFAAIAPDTPRSIALFSGPAGEYLTQAQTYYLSDKSTLWSVTHSLLGDQVSIRYVAPTEETSWSLIVKPPIGQAFVAGQGYTIGDSADGALAALDVSHDSRGCSKRAGTLFVREWMQTPGSAPQRFSIDFEFFCGLGPAMTGTIQHNSMMALPVLQADRTTLAFGVARNASSVVGLTPAQTVQVRQVGGTVSWQLQTDQPWLVASPASGTGAATITVKLKDGFTPPLSSTPLVGHVTFLSRGAIAIPDPVTVTTTLVNATSSTAPVGVIDSPAEGASVAGSIGITGWTLDDVAVSQLRLYRAPVAGEPPGQLVFVGYPVRVEGARPDVAEAFPAAPSNSAAGWGYMLLTNMLPNGGNGTFTFYAYADDVEGHTALLGTRTIVAANAASLAPFGAIDTPGQGAVVSGLVNNFGWVLSPGTGRADPPGGGTVQVFVDGVPIGSPTGWTSRPDLSALFPVAQYSGVATALGVFALDTTALADGAHTIAWAVSDNAGGTAGVGSRYFTVFNGAAQTSPGVAPSLLEQASIGGIRSINPVQGRIGFASTAAYRDFYPNDDGTIVVQAHELERIELRLSSRAGYLLTGAGPQPLPIGAAFDEDGTFTWQPGVAYLGTYRFVFDTASGPSHVEIVLNPRR